MALFRTTQKHARAYVGGYEMSGFSRSIGLLDWTFDEVGSLVALSDPAKGYLPGSCEMTPTALNANFDNSANSLHAVASAAGVAWVCSFPVGMGADPAQGDPVYCGLFQQTAYQAQDDGGGVTVSIPFSGWDVSQQIGYPKPWGRLLHPYGVETAVNTAIGIDDLAASAFGGYMAYHIFAGDGTATIKVQKSTTTNLNASFSDLSGATSGSIDCSTPSAGIVALGRTASIGQFLRWQIVLGTATTVTFALSWVRGINN